MLQKHLKTLAGLTPGVYRRRRTLFEFFYTGKYYVVRESEGFKFIYECRSKHNKSPDFALVLCSCSDSCTTYLEVLYSDDKVFGVELSNDSYVKRQFVRRLNRLFSNLVQVEEL